MPEDAPKSSAETAETPSRYWPIVGLWFEPYKTGLRLRSVGSVPFAALVFVLDLIVLAAPLVLVLSFAYRELEYSRLGHTGPVAISTLPLGGILIAAIVMAIASIDLLQRLLGGVGSLRSVFMAITYGILPAPTWACIAAVWLMGMHLQDKWYLEEHPEVRMIREDMPMAGAVVVFNFLTLWAPLFAFIGLASTAITSTQLLRGVTGLRMPWVLTMMGVGALLALGVVVLSLQYAVIPIER
ncbi:MAG: hypothetical protein GC168_07485 [Candidatus Hydrogenedens sp.]|nr:hypothetical protein [Candidatus Hydrogenedens sp.]